MIALFDRLALPLLRVLDPEDAHDLVVAMLKLVPLKRAVRDDERLALRIFGRNFSNPIGIAAGFDKNAEVPEALLRLGFGFVEIGTVTLLQQAGNPRPRVFRLDADQGVINRLGFNSKGAEAVLARLAGRPSDPAFPAGRERWGGGIVGVNIGANKDVPDRIVDYVRLIECFVSIASYVTINVSSPNTPGLRTMQGPVLLDDLLARVIDARERATARRCSPGGVGTSGNPTTPVLLKIAPDLSLSDLDDVIGIARSRRVDGLIVGNTTLTRPAMLRDTAMAKEAGGLSGRPLLPLANRMLAETYVRVEGAFPLVGAGGIDSGQAALSKIRAGASLIQVYSGLIFRGLGLLTEIKSTLLAALARAQKDSLKEFIGAEVAAVTAEPWPQ